MRSRNSQEDALQGLVTGKTKSTTSAVSLVAAARPDNGKGHLFAELLTAEQEEAFKKFRGRDVDTNALMRDRGFYRGYFSGLVIVDPMTS